MAIEYPDGKFVENALVFAPGKTIIGSLRELAVVPLRRDPAAALLQALRGILQAGLTRDGDPDVPMLRGSSFNVVVTNTEKIRMQSQAVRKRKAGRSSRRRPRSGGPRR